MTYPYRTEQEQTTLDHMPHSPFAYDDQPYLNMARYSMSGYDPREVENKAKLDSQGAKDNLWWLNYRKENTE